PAGVPVRDGTGAGAHRLQAVKGTDRRGCPVRAGGSGRLSTRYLQIGRAALARALIYAEAHNFVGRNVAKLIEAPKGQVGRPSRSFTLDPTRALVGPAATSP